MNNFGLPSVGGLPGVGAGSVPIIQVVTPNATKPVSEPTTVAPAYPVAPESAPTATQVIDKAIAKEIFQDVIKPAEADDEPVKKPAKAKAKTPAKKATAKKKATIKKVTAKVKAATKPTVKSKAKKK